MSKKTETAVSPSPAATEGLGEGERIAKFLARAGVASRRGAEAMIEAGRVSLNGTVLDTPAVKVAPGDAVAVDGKPVGALEPTRLWRHHKPAGLVTTHKDPEGRATVFSRLPGDLPRVISVGRLDINSEGLLLLTNDGALARRLELPATGWLRRYRVRVHGRVKPEDLLPLTKGIEIEGVRYGAMEASLDRVQGGNAWLTMALREGKNREIKRVMEHLGFKVTRLIRLSYGPFQLGDLPVGAVKEVPQKVLRDQLGGAAAAKPDGTAVKKTAAKKPLRKNAKRAAPKRPDADTRNRRRQTKSKVPGRAVKKNGR